MDIRGVQFQHWGAGLGQRSSPSAAVQNTSSPGLLRHQGLQYTRDQPWSQTFPEMPKSKSKLPRCVPARICRISDALMRRRPAHGQWEGAEGKEESSAAGAGRRAELLASPRSVTHSQRALMGWSCTQAQSFWTFIFQDRSERKRAARYGTQGQRRQRCRSRLSKASRHSHGAVSQIFPQMN